MFLGPINVHATRKDVQLKVKEEYNSYRVRFSFLNASSQFPSNVYYVVFGSSISVQSVRYFGTCIRWPLQPPISMFKLWIPDLFFF